jgi:hypothetical protein
LLVGCCLVCGVIEAPIAREKRRDGTRAAVLRAPKGRI